MSEKLIREKIVEIKINWYIRLVTILTALLAGCMGWFVGYARTGYLPFVFADVIVMSILIIGISTSIYKFRYYLKKLGDHRYDL